jgi:hypothetical protein
MSLVTLAAQVLRSPVELIDRIEVEGTLAEEAPRLLALLVLGALVFGGVAGGYRGGLQVPFAAVKLPILLLVPTVLVLPAVQGLWGLCDVTVSYRRLTLAALTGGARMALLAAAAGPVLWLAFGILGYHGSVLFFAFLLGVCGLPGLMVVARAVPRGGRGRLLALAGSLALLGLSTMQTGWILRPFLLRPQTEHAVFLRPVEADVFEALGLTTASAQGVYLRSDEATDTSWDGQR